MASVRGRRPAVDLGQVTEWDAVVIRTDYSNDGVWQKVTADLRQPWGEGVESSWHVVEGAGWAGADADEVLAALPDHLPDLHDVVFLADVDTMYGEQNSLLAVSTDPGMRDEGHEIPGLGSTSRFRILPTAVAEMVGNLAIANMDYEDFSSSAHGDPQRIHRGFLAPE